MRGEVEKTHMNTVFRAVISPRNTNYIGPNKHGRPDRHLTDIEVNFSPRLLFGALHGTHYLTHNLTGLTKFTLEKETS